LVATQLYPPKRATEPRGNIGMKRDRDLSRAASGGGEREREIGLWAGENQLRGNRGVRNLRGRKAVSKQGREGLT